MTPHGTSTVPHLAPPHRPRRRLRREDRARVGQRGVGGGRRAHLAVHLEEAVVERDLKRVPRVLALDILQLAGQSRDHLLGSRVRDQRSEVKGKL